MLNTIKLPKKGVNIKNGGWFTVVSTTPNSRRTTTKGLFDRRRRSNNTTGNDRSLVDQNPAEYRCTEVIIDTHPPTEFRSNTYRSHVHQGSFETMPDGSTGSTRFSLRGVTA